jgi:hypothetical protein
MLPIRTSGLLFTARPTPVILCLFFTFLFYSCFISCQTDCAHVFT